MVRRCQQSLLTSKNNGHTWKDVSPQSAPYMAIVGDGSHLYTQTACSRRRDIDPAVLLHIIKRRKSLEALEYSDVLRPPEWT